jgi:hypothetical protein
MLIINNSKDIVQMLSEDVDRVRDLSIGDRPSNVKYIRRADFAVLRRREVRWLNCEELLREGKLSTIFGVVD